MRLIVKHFIVIAGLLLVLGGAVIGLVFLVESRAYTASLKNKEQHTVQLQRDISCC